LIQPQSERRFADAQPASQVQVSGIDAMSSIAVVSGVAVLFCGPSDSAQGSAIDCGLHEGRHGAAECGSATHTRGGAARRSNAGSTARIRAHDDA